MNKMIITAAGGALILMTACKKNETKEQQTVQNTAEQAADPAVRNDSTALASRKQNLVNYAAEAQKLLGSKLKEKIEQGGPENALEFCNINAIPLTESVAEKHRVTIKRVSDRYRNPDNAAGPEELAVIEQYKTMLASGKMPEAILKDDHLYTPIVTNAMCLQCHGTPGKELKTELNQKIKALYPKDKATGYIENELRGIFSIKMKP